MPRYAGSSGPCPDQTLAVVDSPWSLADLQKPVRPVSKVLGTWPCHFRPRVCILLPLVTPVSVLAHWPTLFWPPIPPVSHSGPTQLQTGLPLGFWPYSPTQVKTGLP
ncbi:hypothetical protein M404DRAFT_33581 [Pisolithus tinctorius Marx 270]|uniref:Uncharacterized protein n=1 Tax=Pisolithus tinctorius Marx 270 TaxID=870435 RepID=A0A0C3NKA9_PISTI|nr:hypothetical protein M404DRAFT_33581 [Pisolithus tinctorius Marx 270]